MTAPYAPQFLSPAAPGQLSNTRGSNTGADKIALKVRYANPNASGDKAGCLKVTATQTAIGGLQQAAQSAWASQWIGTPAASSLPGAPDDLATYATTRSAIVNGRVYVAAGQKIYSAPLAAGANIGTWRAERPFGADLPGLPYCNSLTALNGRLYAIVAATSGVGGTTLAFASVNPDGTLGSWALPGAGVTTATSPCLAAISDGSTYAWLYAVGGGPTGSTAVQFVGLSLTDGKATGTWANAANALPAVLTGHSVWIDVPNLTIYTVGGDNGTTAQTTVQKASITTLTGGIGAWSAGAALPAGRTNGVFVVAPQGQGAYYLGGQTAPGAANGSTVVYYILLSNLATNGNVWTTSANALPAAISLMIGITTPIHWTPYGGNTYGAIEYIAYAGGKGTAGAQLATVRSAATQGPGGAFPQRNDAFTTGAAAGLTAGQLGTGGVVTNNQDGTQDVTFSYQAFGAAAGFAAGFTDGDQVTVSLVFTSSSGDLSPASATVVKIGQPPSISGIAPSGATANREPTVTFNFSAGAGGGPEYSWRVRITHASTTDFDTGLKYDNANSVLVNPAPLLLNATLFTITVDVVSTDSPMAGSLASATLTATFTPTATAPTVPTPVTATPDHVNALITVQWTNPGGSTATLNRVYYRLTGGSTWTLIKDNVTAIIGSAQSVQLMEELKLGQAYDFAVAALTATAESALSTVAASAALVPSTPAGAAVVLHVVGNGPAQHAALLAKGPAVFTRHVDAVQAQGQGDTAPRVRTGVFSYRSLKLTLLSTARADVTTLDSVLAAALTGSVLCYRDTLGELIYCGVEPDRDRSQLLYFDDALRLVEVAFTYAP